MIDSFWKNKKVFLTGHTGFKGAWLAIWLTKLGAQVTGYALNPPTSPSLFEICELNRHISSITGDIRNLELLTKVMKESRPEIVFHLAAQPLVRVSYQDPVETYSTNVMGTVNVLEAVRNCDTVRAVVNVTTDKCYENKESFWGYREEDPLGGYDPYSNSKACSEFITDSYRNSFFNPVEYKKHGVAIATARAGNVIGGGDFALDRLVPDCIKALIEQKRVLIRNPKAVRPWQHVFEPLTGYILLARALYNKGPQCGGAWNFGPNDENEQDVEYIVSKICNLWQVQYTSNFKQNEITALSQIAVSGIYDQFKKQYEICQQEQPHETSFLKLNSYKARKLLDFQPKWHLDKSIEMVVRWTQHYYYSHLNMMDMSLSQIEEYESQIDLQ